MATATKDTKPTKKQFDRTTLPKSIHEQPDAPNVMGADGLMRPNPGKSNPKEILGIEKMRAGNILTDPGAALVADNARDHGKEGRAEGKGKLTDAFGKAGSAAASKTAKAADDAKKQKEVDDLAQKQQEDAAAEKKEQDEKL